MIRNIFFDLDDTLLDFHKAESVALSDTLRAHGVDPARSLLERYSVLNQQQWQRLERGETTRDRVKVERFENLFAELGLDVPARSVAAEYERRLGIGHWFIDGAESLLETLYGKYRLYIVSNGTLCVQQGRLKSANIAHYFEDIFISEEIGADKPSPRFFNTCFARIDALVREETVIIGDSLTSDILGGLRAGLRTVWFHPRGRRENMTDIVPEYELERLSALPALLEKL